MSPIVNHSYIVSSLKHTSVPGYPIPTQGQEQCNPSWLPPTIRLNLKPFISLFDNAILKALCLVIPLCEHVNDNLLQNAKDMYMIIHSFGKTSICLSDVKRKKNYLMTLNLILFYIMFAAANWSCPSVLWLRVVCVQ